MQGVDGFQVLCSCSLARDLCTPSILQLVVLRTYVLCCNTRPSFLGSVSVAMRSEECDVNVLLR